MTYVDNSTGAGGRAATPHTVEFIEAPEISDRPENSDRAETLTIPEAVEIPGPQDERTYRRRWRILAILILSLIVISLDNTILNVALPQIQRGLHASPSALQWIVDSYMLAFAALLLLAGNLGDRDGRKLALQFGLLTFAAGSIAAVCSDTVATLVVARIVMGIGAAFIMPATLSITSSIFVGPERTKAVAIWTASAGIGVALGPVAGGWLLEHFWWGSVFLINIPIVAIALLTGARLVPESRDEHAGRPDTRGAALASLACTAIVYGIIAAPDHGWTSVQVLASLALGVIVLALFVRVEQRSANPLLPIWFFRNPSFATASVCITLVFFALYGSLYLLTLYLQAVRGYSTLEAGLRTIAVAAGIGAAAPLGPHLGVRFGNRKVVATGLTLTALGVSAFTWIEADTSYAVVAVALMITGLGMGATMAPATDAIIGSVPSRRSGVGSAVNDMMRQLGGALGVAVLGSLLAARYTPLVDADLDRESGLAAVRSVADESIGAAHVAAQRVGPAAGARLRAIAGDAYVSSMHLTIVIAVGVLLLGAIVAAAFLPAAPAVSIQPAAVRAAAHARPRPRPGRHRVGPNGAAGDTDDAGDTAAAVAGADLDRRSRTSRRVRRRNTQVVARVLREVVGRRRLDLIDELYHPDVLDHDPILEVPPGLDGIRETVAHVHDVVPDYRVEILDLTAVDDLVVARCRVAVRALRPVPSPGQDRYQLVTTIWRVTDGKISERWALHQGAAPRARSHRAG